MNVRSIGDLKDILIEPSDPEVGSEVESELDYDNDEFEDESPVKTQLKALRLDENDLPMYEETFPDQLDRTEPSPISNSQQETHSPTIDTLETEEEAKKNNSYVEQPSAFGQHTITAENLSQKSTKMHGKRLSKAKFMSRVSFPSSPGKKIATDSCVKEKVVEPELTNNLDREKLEEVIRQVISGIEQEKRENMNKNVTRKAISIPSLRSFTIEENLRISNFESNKDNSDRYYIDMDAVIPFYDPDYDHLHTVGGELFQPLVKTEVIETHAAKADEPTIPKILQTPLEERKKLDPKMPSKELLFQGSKRHANGEADRILPGQTKNTINNPDVDRIFDYPDITKVKKCNKSRSGARELKIRTWTDERAIDLKILAENIYADFIKDFIGKKHHIYQCA